MLPTSISSSSFCSKLNSSQNQPHSKTRATKKKNIELKDIYSEILVKNIFEKKTIILNVGGIKHQISWNKLEKISTSRLCRIKYAKSMYDLEQLCDGIDLLNNELFFDRSPKFFSSILYFYQTGKLHFLDEVCVVAFQEDLHYWG